MKTRLFSFWSLFLILNFAPLTPSQAVGKASIRLIDLLLSNQGVYALLKKGGIKGDQAIVVKNYINHGLRALSGENTKPSKQQLRQILKDLPPSNYKNQLINLINKPERNLTEADTISAINTLIYLANRYGTKSSTVLACSSCVNQSLSQKGFKFTLQVIQDKKARHALTHIIPSNPKELDQFISRKMIRLEMGDFGKSSRSIVKLEERKILALFLALAENGSAPQKALIEAIKNISTDPQGGVRLVDKKNPHQFWKIFADDPSEFELEAWAYMLKKIAVDANKRGERSKKAAFFRHLASKVAKDDRLKGRYQILKERNCFFK